MKPGSTLEFLLFVALVAGGLLVYIAASLVLQFLFKVVVFLWAVIRYSSRRVRYIIKR